MELNKHINNIVIKDTAFDGSVEQSVESDITLPDYFPDIVKLLKCSLLPNVSSVNSTGDRITAEGNAVLSVLYLSDDGKMHCFEQRIPYSKFVESKAVEGCAVCATAKTEYVNCRVASQRRLDIHGSISINFKAFCKKATEVICSCDDKSVQMQKEKYLICNLRDCCEKCFTISETLEIGASQGSIGQIVRSEAAAIIEDTKIVAGKILIKGEFKIKTVYLTENELELQHIESSMPISQIVEADTDENSQAMLSLGVSSLEVFAKTDSSGALRLIDMTAVIRADIEIYNDDEIECACDCYSTEFELDSKKSTVRLQSVSEKFYDTYLCRGSLDLTGNSISSVLDMYCTGITSECEIVENELRINGTVTVNLLLCDAENQPLSIERQFDYEYKRTVSQSGGNKKCVPNISVTGASFLLGAENRVDARVEIDINAVIFTQTDKTLICDIEPDLTKPKKRKTASLTIYFAEQGESIWNIARKYNTTVEAVRAENKLTDNILTEKCKLLIPTV